MAILAFFFGSGPWCLGGAKPALEPNSHLHNRLIVIPKSRRRRGGREIGMSREAEGKRNYKKDRNFSNGEKRI